MKTIEAQQKTVEKENTSKLTRMKIKQKEQMQELTNQFETQIRDKLTESKTLHGKKVTELESQIRTLQA